MATLMVVFILSALVLFTSALASSTRPQESGAAQILRVTGKRLDVPEASLYISDSPQNDATLMFGFTR